VLLLDEMKRRGKKKRDEERKVVTGERRRGLTFFFREKKDILLDLMNGMVGGVEGWGRLREKEEAERLCSRRNRPCLRFADSDEKTESGSFYRLSLPTILSHSFQLIISLSSVLS
jgi:hypothetical protein